MTDYGMYTDEGNERIDILVENARTVGADWPTVFSCLIELQKDRKYSECCDTVVRECVYRTLGFTTPFYI